MIEGHTRVFPGGQRARYASSDVPGVANDRRFFRRCVSAVNCLQALARVLDNRTLRGYQKRWQIVQGPRYSPRLVRDPWRRHLDALAVVGRE